MKYQGKITDPKDLVTKEYVDNKSVCIVAANVATDAETIYSGFSGALDNSGNPTRPIIIRRQNGITTTVDLALATVTEGLDGQTSYLLYTFTGVEAKTTYYLGIKKKGSTITFSPDYTRKNLQEELTFDTTPTAGSTNPVTSGGVKSALDSLTKSFTVTLAAASWSNSAQTVSNANFVASGYAYVVSPASASFSAYTSAQIYADDVTTDGSMTFHCATTPGSDLTVNVLREAAT